MDKQQYKEMIAEQFDEITELKTKLTNKARQLLRLEMENAELKDRLENHGCHAEVDGLEVGQPSDYEDDKQLNLFDRNIYESPDGGKTVYKRKFGDYNNREEVRDPRDISND
tara:strand:+ start:727 stop:1062 length:336 start_codon:yes stop_codon:yes gene_type:complete